MQKATAAAGSTIFFAIAPGIVVGVLPWLLTRWQAHEIWTPLRVVGVIVLAFAGTVLIHSFVRFVVEGFGTPAPVAPPTRLVVGGLYRYVRNPMYVAVVTAIAGQALIFGQLILLWYALGVWAAMAAFARWHEEPTLSRKFGAQYDEYRRAVPAWVVRPRPWTPPEGGLGSDVPTA